MSCRSLPRLLRCAADSSPPLGLSRLPCNKDLGWMHCWAPGWGGAPSWTPTPSTDSALTACQRSAAHHCSHPHADGAGSAASPSFFWHLLSRLSTKCLFSEKLKEREKYRQGEQTAWQQPRPAFSCPHPMSFPSLPQPFSSTHGIRQPTCEGQGMYLKAFTPPGLGPQGGLQARSGP